MCGIVGLISNDGSRNFKSAVAAIAHRGPDFGSIEECTVAGQHISLGHRRLSILDLTSSANQPFSSDCGRYTLVFNGEIYNHVALRAALKSSGISTKTRSDTEVLLLGLVHRGREFLTQLNGMYAFAMLDKVRGKMLLARDPFGIKPLYLKVGVDRQIAFASEVRAIAAISDERLEPDGDALAEFLLNGFIYEPSSGYSGVAKIPPGCAIEIDLASSSIEEFRFFDPLNIEPPTASFESILFEQVELELEADVKTGLFFSGGVDSSVLAAAAPSEIQAMYVEYGQEGIGDAPYVDAMAQALNLTLHRVSHTEDVMTADAIVTEFDEVARGTEEPISDYTYIATRAISRYAREAGFKVMLSGMGGDELFAGYPRYVLARHWPTLSRVGPMASIFARQLDRSPRWNKRSARLASFLAADSFAEAYTSLVGYFSADEVAAMLGSRSGGQRFFQRMETLLSPVRHLSTLRQAMHLDRHGFLAHNLTVTDKASMAESIEVRVPLLTSRLAGFAASLQDSEMLRRANGKLPLRRFLESRSPTSLVNRPKVGFNPPLDGRINHLGRGLCLELICSATMKTLLDTSILTTMVNDHFDRKKNNTYRIWQMIYLSLWLKNSQNRIN